MRVSVIGGRGFIGKALCEYLVDQGCDVYAPARGSLEKPLIGWGRVVWAAGLTANFRQMPIETVQSHVSDLANLLHTGGLNGLVYLSSTRVYQRSAKTSEKTPLPCLSTDPSDLYNLSKLMGESLSLNAGVEAVKIARLSNVIGPHEARRATFLGALCREAQNGEIELQSAPDSCKDYLWINDAVAYLGALTLDDQIGVFNIASGKQTKHMEWVNAIAGEVSAEIKFDTNAPSGGFAPINVQKLHAIYGPAQTNPIEKVSQIAEKPKLGW